MYSSADFEVSSEAPAVHSLLRSKVVRIHRMFHREWQARSMAACLSPRLMSPALDMMNSLVAVSKLNELDG